MIPVVHLPDIYRISDEERAMVIEVAGDLANHIGAGGLGLTVRLTRQQLALLTAISAMENRNLQELIIEFLQFVAKHEYGIEL